MAATLAPGWRERAVRSWQLRTRVERVTLKWAAGLAVAVVAWIALWQPMARDSERLERRLVAQRAALAEAQRAADDIASLTRNSPAPAPRDARADLDAALAAAGIKPAGVDRGDDGRLRVTIDAISFDALAAMLDTLQHDARLRAVELTATARVEPGQVRAELVLAQ
jgi:type II secretory pathway component PulM